MKNLETELENFSSADEQMIRRYLLGDLSAEEEELLGTKLLNEPGAEEIVSLIEEELFEDYTAGRLSQDERASFERFCLTTGKERENLQFFQSLRHAARNIQTSESQEMTETNERATAAPAAASRLQTLWRRFMNWQRQPIYGLVLILILVGAGGLIVWLSAETERAGIEREIARLNQNGDGAKDISDIALNPHNIRAPGEELPKVQIHGEQEVIRFRLNLTDFAAAYRAVFFDGKGAEIFTVSNLAPQNLSDGKALVFFVPARFFKRDDYHIQLQEARPDKSFVEAESYEFRIMEK